MATHSTNNHIFPRRPQGNQNHSIRQARHSLTTTYHPAPPRPQFWGNPKFQRSLTQLLQLLIHLLQQQHIQPNPKPKPEPIVRPVYGTPVDIGARPVYGGAVGFVGPLPKRES
ncbi:MAG: hypothetical protein KAH22_05425 [Thiotrichaceae bacterium]|nr:hypothetical protein [Thiotrichaceae bacterium]